MAATGRGRFSARRARWAAALTAGLPARRLGASPRPRRARTATSPTPAAVREPARPRAPDRGVQRGGVHRRRSRRERARPRPRGQRHGAGDDRARRPRTSARPSSTTRRTSSSTARRRGSTTSAIRRRRRGATRESKVAGDRLVAAANPRHFILRVGCLYGHGGRNFPVDDRAPPARRRDDPRRPRSPRLADLGARGRRRLGGAGHDDAPRPLPLHRPGRDDLGRLRPAGGEPGRRAGRARPGRRVRRPAAQGAAPAARASSTTARCARSASTRCRRGRTRCARSSPPRRRPGG